MQGKNKTLKSIIGVALSNCTTIVSGLVVGFLIPKILSIEDYGMYKTFSLYTTYIGFFSMGIIDGIVLDYGGKDYGQLKRSKFRSFFKWYIAVHAFFAVILTVISFFLSTSDYRFIVLMLGLDMVAVNITGYFQQISQFTQRFNEFSFRKVLQSLCNILIAAALYMLYKQGSEINYKIYVVALIATNCLLTMWYVYTYRDISFGRSEKMRDTFPEIVHLIQIGFPLLFANLCSTLILTLDRQFVNVLFDNATYAVYAFAYNMLSLVTVATSAISTVLYPTLKRVDLENIKNNYPILISVILSFVFAANITYFPLCIFVKWFLPKYTGSLIIFRVIFPGLAISSAITVVMHNYYKVLGKNFDYFLKSIMVLVISGIANAIVYTVFRTTISISIASIITMIFWYVLIEQYFVKAIGYDRKKNLWYLLIMLVAFYTVSAIPNEIAGFFVYGIVFTVVTLLIHRKTIKQILQMFSKNRK